MNNGWLMLFLLMLAHTSPAVADRSEVYHTVMGNGWSVSVVHSSFTEPFGNDADVPPLRIIDRTGVERGGKWHTDLLVMLVTNPARPREREVAWTYTETRNSLALLGTGFIQPQVVDVAMDEQTLHVVHIGSYEFWVSVVSRDDRGDWKTVQSSMLDVSSLATGQERVGIQGRIIELDGDMYFHFDHSSLPGDIVFRVVDGQVTVEDAEDVIDKVIANSKQPQ